MSGVGFGVQGSVHRKGVEAGGDGDTLLRPQHRGVGIHLCRPGAKARKDRIATSEVVKRHSESKGSVSALIGTGYEIEMCPLVVIRSLARVKI